MKTIEVMSADNIRILSAAMVEKAKSGHPGGAMGGADFVNILYSEFLNFDPSDSSWSGRDRFFLDPGHMSPMLYSILTLTGNYSLDDLKNFRQWGSVTPGHPEVDVKRGVENTSGPLGQGHTMAVGAAIAERYTAARFGEWLSHKTYTFISDGGVQEEISQGAGRIAGFLGLSNLIMFYDSNDIQLSTSTDEVSCEDTAMKYESWGWKVVTINGNDSDEIREALKQANAETEKPFLIIGKTVMGKGCVTDSGESFEAQCSTHGQPISAAGASFAKTVENLGGNAEAPFTVFPEVEAHWEKVKEEKSKIASEKRAIEKKWRAENSELATKLDNNRSNKIEEIDFSKIEQKPNVATRVAVSTVFGEFGKVLDNMIVSSADLSNSDKTDGYLKQTTAITKDNFLGKFLQAGVAELTMASIMNGIALYGGIIPACGTFFVFSEYMKPAIRMSALMELPVKFVWSHDAFRVGEDGPTHQPVEQEAQIRLMEKLKNHSGQPSMLVLRPADAAEATVACKMALENISTPTGLILSRQNIKDIPALEGSTRYQDALQAVKGAYIVKEAKGTPDVVLIASGSEVSTLFEGAAILEEKNDLNIQIVSVPSEGLFRLQEKEYQNKVIPTNLPTFGLTAGLPVNLEGLVGGNGHVVGLESFGFSAPAGVLDEKLGYTGENVYFKVLEYLDTLN